MCQCSDKRCTQAWAISLSGSDCSSSTASASLRRRSPSFIEVRRRVCLPPPHSGGLFYATEKCTNNRDRGYLYIGYTRILDGEIFALVFPLVELVVAPAEVVSDLVPYRIFDDLAELFLVFSPKSAGGGSGDCLVMSGRFSRRFKGRYFKNSYPKIGRAHV